MKTQKVEEKISTKNRPGLTKYYKNMNNPFASIIILNWNGHKFIHDCLSSLKKQTYTNFEVIFVDNGSTDESVNLIKKHYSDFVKLIINPTNLGFAEGNNIGIQAASGEYIVLLNNDTEVEPQWLEELVKTADSDEKIGMCASKILDYYNRRIIDNVGHIIYKDGLNRGRGRLEEDLGQYNKKEEVLFPSGCAALYKRKMLDEIGLFDKEFFAYGDDTDLGLRGRFAGWKCIYVPKAVVYHKYSGSSGAYSPFKAFYVERNRVWIAVKYFPLRMLVLSPYYTLIRLILQGYGAITHRGAAGKFTEKYSAGQLMLILIKAYLSATKGLPSMWAKRKKIKKLTKVSHKEIYTWFVKYGISVKELALKD